jgi:hypothetical protein
MSTPTVIEITRRPEPVVHDPFIDDLRVPFTSGASVTNRTCTPNGVTGPLAGCWSGVRMPPSNR